MVSNVWAYLRYDVEGGSLITLVDYDLILGELLRDEHTSDGILLLVGQITFVLFIYENKY